MPPVLLRVVAPKASPKKLVSGTMEADSTAPPAASPQTPATHRHLEGVEEDAEEDLGREVAFDLA